LDAAYSMATVTMGNTPPRALFHTKTMSLLSEIFGAKRTCINRKVSLGIAPPLRNRYEKTCEKCSAIFSPRHHRKCPSCFPPKAAPIPANCEQVVEAKTDAWRQLTCAPFAQPLPWDGAFAMKWCHGGSGGTFVLRLPNGAICVKSSDSSPEELFSQRLATAFGVRTAQMRIVLPADTEIAAVWRALHQAEPMEEHHRLKLQILCRTRPFVVMEYIDGHPMMGVLAHEQLKNIDASSQFWHELGRLMAFDMLINNFDRMPLAWSNEGNLGNVMIASSSSFVVGIDQCIRAITHPTGMKNYLDKICRMVALIHTEPMKAYAPVKAAINNNTGIEIDAQRIGGLRAGSMGFFWEIVHLISSGKFEDVLNDVSKQVANVCPQSGAGTSDPTPVCCDFVRAVAQTIQKALQVPSDNYGGIA